MFSKVDKMITSGIATGVSYTAGSGMLTADESVSLVAILTTLAAAVIGAALTYLVPNRS